MEEFTLNSLLVSDYGGSTSFPVESWSPEFSGDIDIEIDAMGQWWHEGALIKRGRICSLFARLLIRVEDDYYIITPVEKWRIRVNDCPFIVHDINTLNGQFVASIGYLGDVEIAKDSWRLTDCGGENRPEIELVGGLSARLSRNLFYRLAEQATETEAGIGWYSPVGWLPLG